MSEIFFADINSESVEAAVLSDYEKIAGTTLYPGDPVRLFLEALTYTLTVQNNVINLAGRQNLLPYASGSHLDYLGLMVGCSRLAASHAVCKQGFYLTAPLAFDVTVPAGTRVATGDGKAVFTVDADGIIPAGSTSLTLSATCQNAGSAANGLVPGQITQLIDPVAYIASTSNTSVSLLGSDTETDGHYRQRIQEAPESFTCAGPIGSYRSLAMSCHQDISEVAVFSPTPGTVDVRPVMNGGDLPSPEILELIREKLSADDVRPLTDTVIVRAPEIVPYDINFTWYLPKEKEALLATVTTAVAKAVEDYRKWQRQKPGRDILPLRLLSLLEQAGARRVEMNAPEFTALEPWQLARDVSVKFTFGGVED